jgi:hypothetical protein
VLHNEQDLEQQVFAKWSDMIFRNGKFDYGEQYHFIGAIYKFKYAYSKA